jgi:hypothetical protein
LKSKISPRRRGGAEEKLTKAFCPIDPRAKSRF